MVKAIIFDLNGLFIKSEKLSERFEKEFNIKEEIFLPKLSGIMDLVRKPGAQESFCYWKPALEEWGIDLSEEEFFNFWFSGEHPSEKMISFAKYLRQKGIKVFALSSNFKERSEYYAGFPWMQEVFDKVYYSWQTGFVKPDSKAWLNVINENNLNMEDCIYFDDQEKNIKSAESVGIKSFLFSSEEELEKIVNESLSSN